MSIEDRVKSLEDVISEQAVMIGKLRKDLDIMANHYVRFIEEDKEAWKRLQGDIRMLFNGVDLGVGGIIATHGLMDSVTQDDSASLMTTVLEKVMEARENGERSLFLDISHEE